MFAFLDPAVGVGVGVDVDIDVRVGVDLIVINADISVVGALSSLLVLSAA